MVRRATKSTRDVDYTVPGLLALIGIVLVTALFFVQPNVAFRASSAGQGWMSAGSAIETPIDAPAECEVMSYCDGTKLVRQHSDCKQYEAFCQFGCEETPHGAVCR